MSPRRRNHFLVLATLGLVCAAADGRAAEPTTAECLAASDGSIRSSNEHRLRAERTQLLVCSSASCPSEIRAECIRRVDEVNASIPTIIFEARDATGSDLSAASVSMDGELLAQRLEGVALCVDPGEHTFTFEPAGQPPVRKKFVIREGQKERREFVALAPLPSATDGRRGRRTQRILAIGAAGGGVIALGMGTVFGIAAMSKRADAEKACATNPCANQSGVDMWSAAQLNGNESTVAFILGSVAIGGAALLWFTAPKADASVIVVRGLQIGVGPAGIRMGGEW